MQAEILVVRYNQPELEARCIESVERHTDLARYGLRVVDNYKRDKNLGALWNELIEQSTAEYVCLLNSDTEVTEGWLDKMVQAAIETDAEAVGPMTDHCGNPRQVRRQGDRAEGVLNGGNLSGFCLLLPKKVWEDKGGFREDWPFYGQESDLMRRLTRRMIAREAWVHHEGGASVSAEGRRGAERELGREVWKRNSSFDWSKRLLVIGSPGAPFPLWIGIDQALTEFAREGMESAYMSAETVTEEEVRRFDPDVVLVVNNRPRLIQNAKQAIAGLKCPKGAWFNDLRPAYAGASMAGGFDRVFLCFQSDSTHSWKDWQETTGAPVSYMPQGSVVNTELRPLNVRGESVFIGGTTSSIYHCGRAEAIRALGATAINGVQRHDRIVIERRSPDIYRQHRFVLAMSPEAPGYNSIRLYNIMAYGGLATVKRFEGLDRLFVEGRHFLGWSTVEEARKAMDSISDEEAESIRKAGWRYQQARHTVGARLMNMVANLTTPDRTFWGFV